MSLAREMNSYSSHLAWRYGPSWQAVVTVVDAVRTADADALDRLAAARDAAWSAARAAASAAARAAAIHDLVGQHGYTAEHEALLIGPYATVFGLPWAEQS